MESAAKPRVSIVIPAFNAADDLRENLRSVQSELPEDGELVLVDDGSTDGTAEVARTAGIRVLCQENRGPAAARNAGAREARGETLVFLDADCRPAEGWLRRLLAPLEDPGVDAVKGAYLTEQRSAVARLAQIEFEERYALLASRPRTDFVDSFSMAIRRHVFLESGGFDEGFRVADNEDVDFSYRLAARGHGIAFAPDARLYHRHPDSLGRYFRLKVSRGYHRTIVYERYPGKAWKDSYTPLTLKLQVVALGMLLVAAPGIGTLPVATSVGRTAVAATGLGAALFLGACTPFLRRAVRTDPGTTVAAIPFLGARALAIGVGVLARLLRLPSPRPKPTTPATG